MRTQAFSPIVAIINSITPHYQPTLGEIVGTIEKTIKLG